MTDLGELVELLDLGVATAVGVTPDADREAAAEIASAQRRRRDYLGASIVVAIAGGTGSGKSSLLNAIAGADIASTSPIRPHTDEPLAWAPTGDETMRALLGAMGIEHVVDNDWLPSIALVDLPDLDSVARDHRATVEAVLPYVDAVIWVFDPVKYNDPTLHDDFLGPLVDYQRQFVFVLNKADLLEKADIRGMNALELVVDDLTLALVRDGFVDPVPVVVSARPPHGPPIGIEPLRDVLEGRLASKHAASAKIVEDIAAAARLLGEDAGLSSGAGTGHVERIMRTAHNESWLMTTLSELDLGGPTTDRILADPTDRTAVAAAVADRAHLSALLALIGVACAELDAQLERS